MRFDWTITFGGVLQIITMVSLAVSGLLFLTSRLSQFELILKHHADALIKTSERLDAHEGHILRLVGDLQRLMGQFEERSRRSREDNT